METIDGLLNKLSKIIRPRENDLFFYLFIYLFQKVPQNVLPREGMGTS